MTSTTSVEWSITQISLSNILESCLTKLVDENVAWRRNRPAAVKCRESERPFGNGAYDKSAYDYYSEHIARCDGRAAAFELLLDLYVAIGGNPFPEQKMRLLEVAALLFPEVVIGFSPKVSFRGRAAWRDIFREFDLPASLEIAFPVAAPVNVAEVERKLIELAAGEFTIPVENAREVIVWSPSSKVYRRVKKGLEERGWRWKCVKERGVVRKVIALPEG